MTINGAINIANGGILSLDSASTSGGNQTIGGTGTINLNDAGARLALEGNGTTTLGANVVVRGQGNIGTPVITGGTNNLVNNGRISADVSGGTLTIAPGGGNGNLTNNGTMQVSAGSTLTVTSATIKEIQLSPTNPSSPVGVNVSFTATAILTDATSLDVTGSSTWT